MHYLKGTVNIKHMRCSSC